MPGGIPHYARTSSASARVLTLGGYKQNVNDTLSLIIDDIVQGTIRGIDGIDPNGSNVRIFLDAFALIGDYPAVTAGSDVSGHTSDSFCSFCGITRRKGGKSSQILYSSTLHSKRSSLMRFDERMRAIRSENPKPVIRKHLGTSCSNEKQASSLLSINLANALTKNRYNVSLTNTGMFTSYKLIHDYLHIYLQRNSNHVIR